MGKVVVNACYGGFGISEEAYNWLEEHNIKGTENYISDVLLFKYERNGSARYSYYGSRHHPLIVQCVEELGEKASGTFADLRVVEFEGDLYRINEYDGLEEVETPNDLYWNNVNDGIINDLT